MWWCGCTWYVVKWNNKVKWSKYLLISFDCVQACEKKYKQKIKRRDMLPFPNQPNLQSEILKLFLMLMIFVCSSFLKQMILRVEYHFLYFLLNFLFLFVSVLQKRLRAIERIPCSFQSKRPFDIMNLFVIA